MKRDDLLRRVLQAVSHYVVFFLLVAFVITCCTALFVTVLSQTLGVTFTNENIGAAAKLTFINVLFLSCLFTAFDGIRRKLTVELPVRRITEAAQRIINGDFSHRIEPIRILGHDGAFNEIIDCFNRMAQELSGIETLRTDFVANVSHELKTPLAVMQNYAVMLRQPGLTQAQRQEYSDAIASASRRLADLISNILKLNKLENQQVCPNAQAYDLGEQLCRCLLDFEAVWEKKQLRIETEIADGVQVCADAEMMSLVWNNLFSNAIKFTEPGGTVGLRLSADGPYALVEVSDTGCGIPREVGEHIFDKFYQGDTSHATQGNGLGLALVKRVVDITGSQISVSSQVGKGTTFAVRMRREPDGAV